MEGISASVGWAPASWSHRSSSAVFKAISKFLFFLENWKRWSPPSRRLSNEGERRKVGYARAATLNAKSGTSHETREVGIGQPCCATGLAMADSEDQQEAEQARAGH